MKSSFRNVQNIRKNVHDNIISPINHAVINYIVSRNSFTKCQHGFFRGKSTNYAIIENMSKRLAPLGIIETQLRSLLNLPYNTALSY